MISILNFPQRDIKMDDLLMVHRMSPKLGLAFGSGVHRRERLLSARCSEVSVSSLANSVREVDSGVDSERGAVAIIDCGPKQSSESGV